MADLGCFGSIRMLQNASSQVVKKIVSKEKGRQENIRGSTSCNTQVKVKLSGDQRLVHACIQPCVACLEPVSTLPDFSPCYS